MATDHVIIPVDYLKHNSDAIIDPPEYDVENQCYNKFQNNTISSNTSNSPNNKIINYIVDRLFKQTHIKSKANCIV